LGRLAAASPVSVRACAGAWRTSLIHRANHAGFLVVSAVPDCPVGMPSGTMRCRHRRQKTFPERGLAGIGVHLIQVLIGRT
jgi:hypothetical protein